MSKDLIRFDVLVQEALRGVVRKVLTEVARLSALAEQLQHSLPGTRVVKTLNTMLFSVMTAPATLTQPPTAFLSGDDTDAKPVTINGHQGIVATRGEYTA